MINKKDTSQIGWNLENSYANLPNILFTITNPTPVKSPKLVILNHRLAKSIGFDIDELQTDKGLKILSGNNIPKGSIPIAQAYAGHQFGYFTMLGDGRAILLGEQITPLGKRLDVQLKGSGRTSYSRGGDGRAGLGPMLREYIISEAMHALGIETTRSLAVVLTGEPIYREREQPGAVLTRVAKSHIRVGTFQYASNFGTLKDLKALADYTIERHFSNINSKENQYLLLLREVIREQAELIAKWQLVGFIHGVMNTDNMTISGETIDYGPCAFMDTYDRGTVFSSIDRNGRYAYENQPNIGAWNLARFAETLLPLIDTNQDKAISLAQEEISNFAKLYNDNWICGMRAKLGIFSQEDDDKLIIEELLNIMQKYKADYTNTFTSLTLNKLEDMDIFKADEFIKWYKNWQSRLDRQKESKELSYELMKSSNPVVIPRNHRVEEALNAAVNNDDYSVMDRLLSALSNPYDYSNIDSYYSTPPEKSNIPYKTYCGT